MDIIKLIVIFIYKIKKKIKILSELIEKQENLDKLSLTQCYFAFSSRGFSKISEILTSNNTIKVLYLKNNHLKYNYNNYKIINNIIYIF